MVVFGVIVVGVSWKFSVVVVFVVVWFENVVLFVVLMMLNWLVVKFVVLNLELF